MIERSGISKYIMGFDKSHLPIGLHIIGNSMDEAVIYKLASFIEKKLDLDLELKEEIYE